MAKTITIGASATAEERVQFENTLTAHDHSLPSLFATPDMLRLMEIAALRALKPFCEEGEISVGASVEIEHRAPVGINDVVRAEAVVDSVHEGFIRFKVKATSGKTIIGKGTVTRVIVNSKEFLAKHDILA